MKFQSKIWLVSDNNVKFFGEGPVLLLKKVDQLGSLNKAASQMGMSYSKAFHIIKKAEEQLQISLLISQIGGKSGGGSCITEEAKELILKYEEFVKRSNQAMETIYRDIFSQ